MNRAEGREAGALYLTGMCRSCALANSATCSVCLSGTEADTDGGNIVVDIALLEGVIRREITAS